MKKYYILVLPFLFLSLFSLNSYGQCVPFFGRLVINEIMPANNATATDEFGEYDDWVEIYNSTDAPINLNGYFLSDSHGNRTKFVFPDVTIEANGYLIVWCDGQPAQGPLHTSYKLSSTGEEVGIYNPDSTTMDYVKYGDTPSNIGIGRYPNGTGPFHVLIPTFNYENTNSVEPGLVINEYQAINESTAQDQWGEFADWVELYNNSDEPINLGGYFLSDKVGSPERFQFPDTVLNPDSYLIVWCDQGLMEPGLHTIFKLGGDGDDVLLSDADTLTIDYVRFGLQIPDDTEGRYENGTGPITCLAPTFNANNGSPTGVFEPDSKHSALKIWPNPAHNIVSIELQNLNDQTLIIYDLNGRNVKNIRLKPGINTIQIDGLSKGMYFIRTPIRNAKLVVN